MGNMMMRRTHVARSHVDANTGQQRINEYQVLHEIGRGTFGQVFKVQKLDTLEYFAVKVCRKESLRKMSLDGGRRRLGGIGVNRKKVGSLHGPGGAVSMERRPQKNQSGLSLVLREITLWKNLDHPNIVRLREVINDPDSDDLFMISDFMSGGMLGEMISHPDGRFQLETGPWKEEKVQEVFIDILLGLAYLHHNGIAHRDIKLDNLLLDDDGRVHLADFGLSQLQEVDVIAGSDNQGTPFYLPPSIGRQGCKETFAADFWAFGICLYILLVGEFPFFGKTPYLLRKSIRFDDVVFPPTIPLTDDAKALVLGLLDKNAPTRWSLDDLMKHPWVQMCITSSPYGLVLDSSQMATHSSEMGQDNALESTGESSTEWSQILRLDRVDMSNVDTSEAMTESSSSSIWSSLLHGIRVIGVLRGRLSLARKSLGRRKSSCSSATADDTRLNLLVISPFWQHQVPGNVLFWQRCIDEEWSQDPSLFAHEYIHPGKFNATDIADALTGLIVRFPT
jgi:serine/threonine protein kinase